MNDVSDISQILDQVDRRLGEIRQQIVSIGVDAGSSGTPEERQALSEPPAAADEAAVPPEPPEPPPAPEPPPPPPPGPPEPPIAPEPPPPPGPPPPGPPPPPPEPPPEVAEALLPSSEAGPEMDQLLSLRERLLSDARELIRSYEDEIAALETRFGIASPPALFEGVVALLVTGIPRLQTLVTLEETLLATNGVSQAYVRHYDRGEAWFEITLDQPVALTAELAEMLPVPFEVRSTTANEIVLDVVDDDAG